MKDIKGKKIDDNMLENVSGGKIIFDDKLFGKINEDEKKTNEAGIKPDQGISMPGTMMQA